MKDQNDYDEEYELYDYVDDLPLPPPPEWLPTIASGVVTDTEEVAGKHLAGCIASWATS